METGHTRYYTLFLVRVEKFHLKSGTGNDPPPPQLRDKVPLFSVYFLMALLMDLDNPINQVYVPSSITILGIVYKY